MKTRPPRRLAPPLALLLATLLAALLAPVPGGNQALAGESKAAPTPPPPPPTSTEEGRRGPPKADSVVPGEEESKTKAEHLKGQALAAAMQSYLHAFLALSERVDAVPVVVWDRSKEALRITLVGDRASTVEASSAVRIFRREGLVRTLEILEYAYETQLGQDDYYIEYRNKKNMKLWSRYEAGKFHTP